MNSLLPLLLAVLAFPCLAESAARDVHGHAYAAKDVHEGSTFHLQGAGRWKWKGVVPVYSSALYLEKPEDAGKLDQPVPRCLVITYYREVGKKDLVEAADVHLRKNLTPAQMTAIADPLKRINALYRDVKEGDRYHLVFRPGTGTELIFNGVSQGVIPGDEFGPLYFTVWLGPKCVSDRLRDEMLGKP
jgi:Chalcone isomerase-like